LYETTLLSLDGRGAGGEGESACAVVTWTALAIATTSFGSSKPAQTSGQSARKFVGGLAPKQPNPSHWSKAQSLSQKKVMEIKEK
jgi:hypothetical protein